MDHGGRRHVGHAGETADHFLTAMRVHVMHLSARRRLLLAAFVLVLISPALRDVDSFPLSTQPMYANDRASTARLATVIGRDSSGAPRRLSMRIAAATDDPLIAQSTVARSIRRGQATELCRAVADRIPLRSPLVWIEVGWETVDVVAMVRGVERFGAMEVAAQCDAR